MKKTLATLLVAGALAAAGLSASAAVSATGNSGSGLCRGYRMVAELHSEELAETALSNGGYRRDSGTHRSCVQPYLQAPRPNQRLDF